MSARNSLGELINSLQDVPRWQAFMIADAVVEAGWRAPLRLVCGNSFADGGYVPNPLTAIRAEVERLRDAAVSDPAFNAYEDVLDLLDPCPHDCETGLGDGRWRCTECGRVERHDS